MQLGALSDLFGGLALFLFGLDLLTRSLKILAGGRLRQLLDRLTANRLMAVVAGAGVTATVNSSSVTTVLLVGFVSASLMTFPQSIPVIMGANIGSTVTAQIIAFNVSALALPMVALGFLLSFIDQHGRLRHWGLLLLGLGLVFLGMGTMSAGMAPLREEERFILLMQQMEQPLLAALLGAVFTAVVQSSAATVGLVMLLAGQGSLSLEGAIAIALGANVGTCVTAALAVIGKPREAQRLVAVHILFNLVGVLLWLPFLAQLAEAARFLSPDALAPLSALPRQIANAHTFFNVANTLIFIGFTPQIAALVTGLLPDRPRPEQALAQPRFLAPGLVSTPTLALAAARQEIVRLGELVRGMVASALPVALHGSRRELEALRQRLLPVGALNAAITDYLAQTARIETSRETSEEMTDLLQSAANLEAIGDVVATNLVALGERRLERGLRPPRESVPGLERLHVMVLGDLDRTLAALRGRETAAALAVRRGKRQIHEVARGELEAAFRRLVVAAPERTAVYADVAETIDNLTRIHRLCRKIAKVVLSRSRPVQKDASGAQQG